MFDEVENDDALNLTGIVDVDYADDDVFFLEGYGYTTPQDLDGFEDLPLDIDEPSIRVFDGLRLRKRIKNGQPARIFARELATNRQLYRDGKRACSHVNGPNTHLRIT